MVMVMVMVSVMVRTTSQHRQGDWIEGRGRSGNATISDLTVSRARQAQGRQ